MKIKCQSV